MNERTFFECTTLYNHFWPHMQSNIDMRGMHVCPYPAALGSEWGPSSGKFQPEMKLGMFMKDFIEILPAEKGWNEKCVWRKLANQNVQNKMGK